MNILPRTKKILRSIKRSTTLRRHITHLRDLLVLPCSLGVGLVPPLLWLVLITLWQHITALPAADARPLTAAALLLSPLAAGFAHARQRPQSEVISAALPSFLLWLAAVLLYRKLFALPDTRTLAVTLLLALSAGIGGAMSARRIAAIRPTIAQNKKAEE